VPVLLVRTRTDAHPSLLKLVLAGGTGAVLLALLGLPPLSIHGPLHFVGVMDPLCGMTRAVRFVARGELAKAWRYNPASFLLAFVAIGGGARWVAGRATGHWWNVVIVSRRRTAALFALPVAALWVNQQLNASLLR